ncbi:MAG: hypothetical protein QOE92_1289 [Chloroflexota bacterium]|jgi:uncharacterized protein (DUF58 family)|nr:hypothetical protein [Chloroflexota bacterium]
MPGGPRRRQLDPRSLGVALRRVVFAAALAVLLGAAMVTGIRLAYAMFYFAVVLILASWIWTIAGARRLSITRETPEGAYEVGEQFREHLEVTNDSFFGLPWVEVIDRSAVPDYDAGRALSLGGKKRRRWSSEGRFSTRGRFTIGPLRVTTGDPFGLFRRVQEVGGARTVVVYPRLVDVSHVIQGTAESAGDTVAVGRQVDTPPDSFGLREYSPDDGANRIHWPSTARLGRPMSRSFEKYEGADMMIVLDLSATVHSGRGVAGTLESAVSLAASIAMTGISQGKAVGLVCNDAQGTILDAAPGPGQLRRLLEFLAEARGDGIESFDTAVQAAFMARGQQVLYVISPSLADDWVDRLIAARPRGGARSVVMHVSSPTAGGPGRQATRPPRSIGAGVVWWEIATNDTMFAPAAVAGHVDDQLDRAS